MKTLTLLIAAIFVLVSPIGGAFGDITNPAMHLGTPQGSQETVEDHLIAAQALDQEVAVLEDKVIKMADQISEYDRKPYLDPKSLRRDSLKRIIGSTLKKIATLRERGTWHRTEASRLAARDETLPGLESSHGKVKHKEKQTPSS